MTVDLGKKSVQVVLFVLIVAALYVSKLPHGAWLARNVYVEREVQKANIVAENERLKKELAVKSATEKVPEAK